MADTFLPRTERQAASQKFMLIEMGQKCYRNVAPLPEKFYKRGSQEKYLVCDRIFSYSPARVIEQGWFWLSAPWTRFVAQPCAAVWVFSPAVFIVWSRRSQSVLKPTSKTPLNCYRSRNNFLLPALTITELYRARWRVELFFRWIKQHLHIQSFFGTSENAVKTQVWVAIAVYVLVAIVKKQTELDLSLYKILQVLSITIFEKTPLLSGFSHINDSMEQSDPDIQLQLFNL